MERYAFEGHARTWFTPRQKAELWERWKSGQWAAGVARAPEERERYLRSWFSMEELLHRHAGELRRVVLRRPVELTGGKPDIGQSAGCQPRFMSMRPNVDAASFVSAADLVNPLAEQRHGEAFAVACRDGLFLMA